MLCRSFVGAWLDSERPGLQEAGYEGVFQQKKRDSS